MKKSRVMGIAVLALAGMMAFAGCGKKEENKSENGGSAKQTQTTTATKKEVSGNVATNGSTSMESVIGVLMEQFMADNKQVTITYDATGSGTGIEAVGNGTCDIGLSSRDLKDEEKSKGLAATTIALDGIIVIANEGSKVDDLTIEQITDIYTGKVKNWSEVGGDDLEIAAIGREAGSGTRDGFESITKTKDKCVLSQELTSTGAVIEAVKNSPNAIGYVSFAAGENQKGIKILKVGGVECSEKSISDGSYKIQRNFNLITKDGAKLSDAAQAFFDYITSQDAHELIRKAGVVPAGK